MRLFSWFKGESNRNRELRKWGQSIPVQESQCVAMRRLLLALADKAPPEVDPLRNLSADDLEYLLKICSADFRPREFGDCSVLRLAEFYRLKELGFTSDQSAIIVGMIFNAVGPLTSELQNE
jgi:hypothetical protein